MIIKKLFSSAITAMPSDARRVISLAFLPCEKIQLTDGLTKNEN